MKRIYFIDWLRIVAIVLVFLFHNAHFFDTMYWHVKNPQQSEAPLLFVGFLNIWIMPLFFFLAGSAAVFGSNKPFPKFVWGKVTRLLIPFVVGILILIPPQKYLEQVYHHQYASGYLRYLTEYFSGGIVNYPIGFSIGWFGMLGYHLWFLGHLFVISLMLYHLLKFLSAKGNYMIEWIYKRLSFGGGMILLFIPVAVVRILLKKHFPEYTSWGDFAMFSVYYLIGFVVMKNEGFRAYFVRDRYPALWIALVFTVAYFMSFGMKGTFYDLFQNKEMYGCYLFQEAVGALTTWSWLTFIMALGIQYLDKETPKRKLLNEAVLPFYILHQTVILIVGYFVGQWDWSMWNKFFMITSTSFLIIVVVYRFCIQPFKWTRFLFGMEIRKG